MLNKLPEDATLEQIKEVIKIWEEDNKQGNIYLDPPDCRIKES